MDYILPNGNRLTHIKDSNGYECWQEYDENNSPIHFKNSDGLEFWHEYDKNNSLIHFKDSNGYESWREYDTNNNEIHFKNSNGVEEWYHNGVEITKEAFNKIHSPSKTIVLDGKTYTLTEIKS